MSRKCCIFAVTLKPIDMSNCKSELHLGHEIIDISDPEDNGDTHGVLMNLLSLDGDITFPETTEIVDGVLEGKVINTLEAFEEAFDEVFAVISKQDYYGGCDYDIIQCPNSNSLSLSWVVGGHEL